MGRGTEITNDLKKLMVTYFIAGNSIRAISKILQKGYSTVQYIINKYKTTKNVNKKKRSGRPKTFNVREERKIVRKIKNNPFVSAPKLSMSIENETGKKLSVQTVRNVIKAAGYNGRIVRRKPFISKANQQKRVKYANAYLEKPNEFWDNVLFSDESKFNIFGSDGDGRQHVWRKPNEELKSCNIRGTVKHGGGSVMVWGCMSSAGVGKLEFIETIMNKYGYLRILKDNLSPSVEKLGLPSNFIFQHDNDPKHSSGLIKEYLLYKVGSVLPHPPQSPDLNPIEHLWDELERKIREHTITSKVPSSGPLY